ncbi:MAG TPA: sulfite dehydrogenase, partial [Methylophaga sp.]|nr:sulfite dehydrogenase [Methylophaga sp.]
MPKPSAIEVVAETETNQADNSRRRFLNRMAQLTAGGVGGIIANQVNASTPGSVEYAVPKDPTKVQGREPSLDKGYGTRSQFETETRLHLSAPNKQVSVSFTPLENSRGIITPSGLHFERHYAG